MKFYKSRDVAHLLGITYRQLNHLWYSNKMKPPETDSAGDYVWTPKDIERAKKALKTVKKYKHKSKTS